MTDRDVVESPLKQGGDEIVTYRLTTTPWGSSPTSVSVKIFDMTGGAYTDTTTTNLSGSASVSGDVITLPAVTALTPGKKYRLEIKFTAGGNTLEAWCIIEAER